jgi:hypothetical protein
LASATRDATARYVREAIFDFAELGDETRSRLLADRYATPLKAWIVRYLRGKLVGDTDDLAAPDEAYPLFVRTQEISELRLRDDGSYHFEMNENFKARFSDAVRFQGTSYEVWGAQETRGESRPSEMEVEGGKDIRTASEEDSE